MKTKTLLLLLSLLFILPTTSCKKVDTLEEVPNCITRKIRQQLRESILNFVSTTKYNGNDIYRFNYDDGLNGYYGIYDSECNLICSLYSNFDACEEITNNSADWRTIWRPE